MSEFAQEGRRSGSTTFPAHWHCRSKPNRSGGCRLSWRRSRLRLCGWLFFETTEAAGEALAYATACISALFNDSSTAASDDAFLDRLTPRAYVMLILEGLQRRG